MFADGVDLADDLLDIGNFVEIDGVFGLMIGTAHHRFPAHQNACAHLGFGALKLLRTDLAHHAFDFIAHHRDHLGQVVRPCPGVNAELPVIRPARVKAEDRINQPALFADFLKQARRHATAQQSRKRLHGLVIVIHAADATKAENHMALLKIFFTAVFAAFVMRRRLSVGRIGRQGVKQFRNHRHEHVMIHRARRRNDHAPRRVITPDVIHQSLALHGADDIGLAQNGRAERLAGIGGLVIIVENDIVRRVVAHADFLQHDMPFLLQLVLGHI